MTDKESVIPGAHDSDNQLDGCEIPIVDATLDEDLPAAEGGVA